MHSMDFYIELHVFGAVPVRKKKLNSRLVWERKTYTKMDQIRFFRGFLILWEREWSRFVQPNPFERFVTRSESCFANIDFTFTSRQPDCTLLQL